MSPILRTGLYAFALTALWLVLAWSNPKTTFHLAPLLVAVVVPAGFRLADPEARWTLLAAAAAVGAALALSGTAVLAVAGRLEGPSLLPLGGAATEAMGFSIGGAVAGFLLGLIGGRPRPK